MKKHVRSPVLFASVFCAMLTLCCIAIHAAEILDGDAVQKQVKVLFDPLPSGWIVESTVMDPIWKPLGLRGVNYYAYGGPKAPAKYSARSDVDSPLYQAWFGVYAVAGSKTVDAKLAIRLADLDQRSWLESMGDAHPLGLAEVKLKRAGTIRIDGVQRTLYFYEGSSHSDLSATTTPLTRHVGMAPESAWRNRVAAFHGVKLRGYFASWYDAKRGLGFIVYSTAALFKLKSGEMRDYFPRLDSQFLEMMRNVRIESGSKKSLTPANNNN